MIRKLLVLGIVILSISFFLGAEVNAAPGAPSKVYVSGTQLMVEKRLADGTLDEPHPYIIKGVTWSPATRAPATGKNPANPAQTVDYGFFFDVTNRRPQGNAVLNYWQKSKFTANYMADIAKMKEMNINTVRVYSDFGVDPAVYQPILDEFYNNGIMVIMTVAIAPEDLGIFEVYVGKDDSNNDLPSNNFYATGYMGAGLVLSKAIANPAAGNMCTRLKYTDSGVGWAGVYWQSKTDNWGTEASSYNLTGYDELRFKARGEIGGEQIKIVVGIQSGTYPDTTHFEYGPITLTTNWQSYSIPLAGKDLSRINGGFGVVFEKAKGGSSQTVYLDQIYYYSSNLKKQYKNIVPLYKNHPAILMWSLGNEWNLNAYYGGENIDMALAAELTNLAAQEIKSLDANHPVSSCLGDRFDDSNPNNTIAYILGVCTSVDVWGMNIYRGYTFGDLFSRWESISAKPMYLSEFGTDSFYTTDYTVVDGYQADNCVGSQNQLEQSGFAIGLWGEIKTNLSAINPAKLCLGGLVHEFNDELWKVGNYHVGLGGLADHATSYEEQDTEGFYMPGMHPDGIGNEEYFGVVDADRNAKIIFNDLQIFYRWLGNRAPVLDFIGDKQVAEMVALTFTVNATDPDGDALTYSVGTLPGGATFNASTRVFNWTPSYDQAGIYQVNFMVTDSNLTDQETITVTVANVNRPPLIAPLNNQTVYVNRTLSFSVAATDFDKQDTLTLSRSKISPLVYPEASFNINVSLPGYIYGTFTWTPTATGNRYVTFTARDNFGATESKQIKISVIIPPPPTTCFLGGTPILMADGSTKPIEKVRVGDKVMAYDEATKQLKPDKVKKVFRHQASEYLIVNKDIRVTENHPVYSNGKWVEIGSLKVGDSLVKSDGSSLNITSVTKVLHKAKVYNLEVNPYHTYIAEGIVVHNKLAPPKAVE